MSDDAVGHVVGRAWQSSALQRIKPAKLAQVILADGSLQFHGALAR